MKSVDVTLVYDYGFMLVSGRYDYRVFRKISLTDSLRYGIFKNYPVCYIDME